MKLLQILDTSMCEKTMISVYEYMNAIQEPKILNAGNCHKKNAKKTPKQEQNCGFYPNCTTDTLKINGTPHSLLRYMQSCKLEHAINYTQCFELTAIHLP